MITYSALLANLSNTDDLRAFDRALERLSTDYSIVVLSYSVKA